MITCCIEADVRFVVAETVILRCVRYTRWTTSTLTCPLSPLSSKLIFYSPRHFATTPSVYNQHELDIMLSHISFRPLFTRLIPSKSIHTTPTFLRAPSSFTRPGPPPLPPAEQAEFEALLKANQTIGTIPAGEQETEKDLHQDVRKGPKPEFEGDVNPKTGEQGGPKNDPFVAGDADWQFGGRVTVSFTIKVLSMSGKTVNGTNRTFNQR